MLSFHCILGTSHIQDCIPCPKGEIHWQKKTKNSIRICYISGTFSTKPGSDTCKPCPRDTYASSENSIACTPCPAKQYAGLWEFQSKIRCLIERMYWFRRRIVRMSTKTNMFWKTLQKSLHRLWQIRQSKLRIPRSTRM